MRRFVDRSSTNGAGREDGSTDQQMEAVSGGSAGISVVDHVRFRGEYGCAFARAVVIRNDCYKKPRGNRAT